MAALQSAVNAAKTLMTTDPSDLQIGNAIDAINGAVTGLEATNTGNGGGDPVTVPDGSGGEKVVKPTPGPGDVWEVLDENGNSKVPPEYIYDPDGSLKGTPPALTGDEETAYKDGYIYYTEETPKGSNVFVPIKEDGTRDTENAKWGGPDGKPGGGDDRPAVKNGNEWLAEDPAGSNLWKPVQTATGSGQGTLKPAESWIGGGADGKPTGTDNLKPIIEQDGQYYAGPFAEGDKEYYIGMGTNNKFDTSGNNTGIPSSVSPLDDKLYWDGTGTPGEGGTGGFVIDPPVVLPGMTITGFVADSGYLKGNGENATLTGKVRVLDGETGNESLIPYNAAVHGGALSWTLDPAGQSATLSGNKFLKSTTAVLGTMITVKGTLTLNGTTYPSTCSWIVANADGSVGGGAEGEPSGVKGRSLAVKESGVDVTWREIARTVIDGKSFSLIMRDKTLTSSVKNSAQSNINKWWANNDMIPMTSPLRKYTYKPTLPDGPIGTENGGQENNGHNGIDGSGYFASGWSAPNPDQQVVAENNTAFMLSYAEAAKFCSTKFYNNNLQAYVGSCDVAQQNWNQFAIKAGTWWLRTPPGSGSSRPPYLRNGYVSDYNYTTSTSESVVPALWVSSDLFNDPAFVN